MLQDITMSQLGESVTEGIVAGWLKQVGDFVDEFEPLVEIVTDKVNVEIESEYRGVLVEILVNEGQTVAVGTVLARIDLSAEPDNG